MERSGIFPRRIKVSINVVAWREDGVSEWIARKIQARERRQESQYQVDTLTASVSLPS
jgi:hypothetical protein